MSQQNILKGTFLLSLHIFHNIISMPISEVDTLMNQINVLSSQIIVLSLDLSYIEINSIETNNNQTHLLESLYNLELVRSILLDYSNIQFISQGCLNYLLIKSNR
eukprot:TRINITY_DN12883_c0_g1_i1.p1 TRINITY_DN12883_c0_g1~~TRINITY_DN12883_c0_g1_i1.p1  ORF type:complete len:105 (-),score=1.16 TRINITY_DN12883_c0_g1_i1:1384-1698(-)